MLHAANIIVAPNQFEWLDGEKYLGQFEVKNVRHFATSFCAKYGSSLPWKAQSGKAGIIPAGTVDDDPEIRPFQNIFYESKADWYQEASGLIKYDGLPTKKS